jgi:ribose/xylose/arabinose/galactoside ABC-type transport system permease subunit
MNRPGKVGASFTAGEIAARPTGGARLNMRMVLQYSLWFILAVLVAVFAIITPTFLTPLNIVNILTQVSITGMIAIGMTYVILSQGIDLSVGSIIGLCGVIAALLARMKVGAFIPLIGAVALGGVIGAGFNGFFIARMRLAPFIVTLGSMSIARGLALIISKTQAIYDLDERFLFIGSGNILGIPLPAICFVFLVALLYLVEKNIPFARYIYAVGDNETAAKLSGISVARVRLVVYAFSGLISGLAAAFLTARVAAAEAATGSGYELTAIGAVVIGGTSLNGGKGSVMFTLVGVLILGVLDNGFNMMNVTSYYQQVVKGIFIVLAVLLDRYRNK